jgi:hypothetical protein
VTEPRPPVLIDPEAIRRATLGALLVALGTLMLMTLGPTFARIMHVAGRALLRPRP